MPRLTRRAHRLTTTERQLLLRLSAGRVAVKTLPPRINMHRHSLRRTINDEGDDVVLMLLQGSSQCVGDIITLVRVFDHTSVQRFTQTVSANTGAHHELGSVRGWRGVIVGLSTPR